MQKWYSVIALRPLSLKWNSSKWKKKYIERHFFGRRNDKNRPVLMNGYQTDFLMNLQVFNILKLTHSKLTLSAYFFTIQKQIKKKTFYAGSNDSLCRHFYDAFFQIYQLVKFWTSTACILILLSEQIWHFHLKAHSIKPHKIFFKLSSKLQSGTLHCHVKTIFSISQ